MRICRAAESLQAAHLALQCEVSEGWSESAYVCLGHGTYCILYIDIYHVEKLCSISQLLCCVVYIEYLSHGEALFNITVIVLCVVY